MPKTVDPQSKRQELLTASWDVIAREGLKGATLRRVAAEAGCTTGTLVHYFPDRAALMIAALREAHYGAGRRMAQSASETDSGKQRLRAVLLESLPLDDERLREWRIWLAFWAESMNDAALTREDAERYAEWSELIEGLVAETLGARSRRSANVRKEAAKLIALVDGLGVRIARSASDSAALTKLQRQAVTMLGEHLDALTASSEEAGT